MSLDPRERLKEDDLDVILSPQRRSFGGGCQGSAVLPSHSRRPVSPLENKENESLRMGSARRIGSGRIIAARAFERESRAEKERERERELKDKRFRVSDFVILQFLCSLCWSCFMYCEVHVKRGHFVFHTQLYRKYSLAESASNCAMCHLSERFW